MKGRGKKHLHETPAEFAEAAEVRAFRESRKSHAESWREWEREQRREQIRNMKMPSHPKPRRQSLGHKYPYHGEIHESEAAYRRRLKKWQARFEK
ncbi:MAG: hypothetical protein Q4A24_06605 [Akkermansia sp.]|nr:hypothetical protein [Akkermansia sp.]